MEGEAQLAIDIDMGKRTLWIEGVEIHFEALKTLVSPDPHAVYRFRRDGDVVTVERIDALGGLR